MVVVDVRKAHLCAPASREVFIQIPPEDGEGNEGMCGQLAFSMYGTRDAAKNWAEEVDKSMKRWGFIPGSTILASSTTLRVRCRHCVMVTIWCLWDVVVN